MGSAVLLAPHNLGDDETLFASYLILRYRPKVIVCLRSERMHQPDYPGGPCSADARGRQSESIKACSVLGVPEFEQWEFSDADPPDWKLISAKIHGLNWSLDPTSDLLIAPAFEVRGNTQHNGVALLAQRVALEQDVPLIHYLTYTTDGRSRNGTEVEFEPHWPELKLAALSCYRSQIEHPATAPHFLDGGLREYVL